VALEGASLNVPWESQNPRHRDASRNGDIVMRILSKRQLKELVLYSPQHIARLEKAGKFPKRVKLGPNRVGWVESEVLDWLQERLEVREAT
jgi:prophage regulatory protein